MTDENHFDDQDPEGLSAASRMRELLQFWNDSAFDTAAVSVGASLDEIGRDVTRALEVSDHSLAESLTAIALQMLTSLS